MDQKQKNILLLGLTVVLVAASLALMWPPQKRITQGLDIRGGLSVILTAESTGTVSADDMQRAETIIKSRVDGLGVLEASIQRQGSDSILVQIPGIKDPQQALQALGSTGQLEFVAVESVNDSATVAALQSGQDGVVLKKGTYQPFMTGEVVTQALVGQNQTGEITVNLTMNKAGTDTWGQYTTANIGKQVAIVLDGRVQSAPVVRSAITDGRTEISGNFTPDSAKQLKTVLETGALPVTLVFSESRIVGPTLGQDSLAKGLSALAVGMLLVALYMLVIYRGLGGIAVAAMAVFAVLFTGILAALSRFGLFSLSLPGIAGVVLTVGMAADSSVLILERFREEIRMGKTVRSAANSGSWHGITTSIDADLVTLVSGLALYFAAIGPVKGFAFTLMLGVACDFAMMLLFKRPLIMLMADGPLTKAPSFWGLGRAVADAKRTSDVKGGAANA